MTMNQSDERKNIGCIGKCTSGLTLSELDEITDNVYVALTHPKGRKVFRAYLEKSSRREDVQCLNLHDLSYDALQREKSSPSDESDLEQLREVVEATMSMAEDIDGVVEIDVPLLRSYVAALKRPTKEGLLDVLEDTKLRMMDHLRNAHQSFSTYALGPCPDTPDYHARGKQSDAADRHRRRAV